MGWEEGDRRRKWKGKKGGMAVGEQWTVIVREITVL